MIQGIIFAIIQAATEFLPISSSGHLAIVSNIISEPDLFFFTTLHIASLVAVIIFTRSEILSLFKFDLDSKKKWLCLIIATIPAVLVGIFFKDVIKNAFSSLLYLGLAFIFTGFMLFFTKFTKERSNLTPKKSVIIGLFQAIALLPGVSRSGMTISSALFLGLKKEKAIKFSFLLFIPLSVGAFLMESAGHIYINSTIVISFFVCCLLSLCFLHLLYLIMKKEKFWIFSIYCFLIGVITLMMYNQTK